MNNRKQIYDLVGGDLKNLLNEVREKIHQLSGQDSDLHFYCNRFIFSRLQLDERKNKKKIKEEIYN